MSPLRLPVLLLGLLLGAPAAAAAAPIDDFTDPGVVPASGGLVQANTDPFTLQGGEPVAAGGGCPARDRTAWWSITGNGLPITVATDATTFDTIIAAYESAGATIGTRLGCDGDQSGNGAQIMFPSERGHRYLVQVGGKNNGHGTVRLRFTVARPANDDRASAMPLGTGTAASVDQTGATQEPGEVLRCGISDYAGTVWFRYTAPEAVDARFSAAADFPNAANRSDTVMAIYRGGETVPLACNDDAAAVSGPSALSLRLSPGEYLIQVGAQGPDLPSLGVGTVTVAVADRDRDRDGALEPGDCDDGNAAIRPGALDVPEDGVDQDCLDGDAVNLDRDRDGFTRPSDCRDDRADINPVRVDIPGDAVDQDCKGGPAPFTTLASGISGFFALFRTHTKVTALSVRDAPAGGKLTLTCKRKAKGCPIKRRTRTIKTAKDRINLVRGLRKAELRAGVRLRVVVSKPGFIGLVTTWAVRAGKPPRRIDRCLPPGAKKPRRCPR